MQRSNRKWTSPKGKPMTKPTTRKLTSDLETSIVILTKINVKEFTEVEDEEDLRKDNSWRNVQMSIRLVADWGIASAIGSIKPSSCWQRKKTIKRCSDSSRLPQILVTAVFMLRAASTSSTKRLLAYKARVIWNLNPIFNCQYSSNRCMNEMNLLCVKAPNSFLSVH